MQLIPVNEAIKHSRKKLLFHNVYTINYAESECISSWKHSQLPVLWYLSMSKTLLNHWRFSIALDNNYWVNLPVISLKASVWRKFNFLTNRNFIMIGVSIYIKLVLQNQETALSCHNAIVARSNLNRVLSIHLKLHTFNRITLKILPFKRRYNVVG